VTFTVSPAQLELAKEVTACYADPLRFVRVMYPWRQPGALVDEEGPDDNQVEFLTSLGAEVKRRKFNGSTPVMPILMAETSGHGTGKSAMGAWLVNWILSTRPHSDLTITAGTYTQLEARTWPAVKFWTKLCLTASWWDVTETGLYHRNPDWADTWKAQIQSCKEQNAQAFAGQHSKRGTSGYLFDEASEVPNKVWETASGGLTDGEPMFFAWGQMVRNTGEFYRVCFGDKAARWNHRRVDGRTSRFTNKELLAQWIADYGIDSDYVKVRVLGLPPSASELQYIDKARVDLARKRSQIALPDDPLIAGFDVSGGGRAWNVIRFRRGLNGDVKPPIRIPGDHDPERSQRVGICAELLRDTRPEHRIAALFIDSAFGAAIAVRLQALGFRNVHEINFGGDSPDLHQLNMRAYMYAKAKEWLLVGGLPDDEALCSQLVIPGYHLNSSGKLVLESKKDIQARGEASPDDADAFVLTFAQPVRVPATGHTHRPLPPSGPTGWMGA
jgi:hypothetical protein